MLRVWSAREKREFERATEKATGKVTRLIGDREPYTIMHGDEVGVLVTDDEMDKLAARVAARKGRA
jgi:hypothetical protein